MVNEIQQIAELLRNAPPEQQDLIRTWLICTVTRDVLYLLILAAVVLMISKRLIIALLIATREARRVMQ